MTEQASKLVTDGQAAGPLEGDGTPQAVLSALGASAKRDELRLGTSSAAGGTIAFEDAALVDQCRKGDLRSFEALVAKYQDRVFNLIYRMCGRQADAEELAQETFLKAMEKLGQFRGHSGFYTWLFRIAANLAISHRRRASRIRFEALGDGEDGGGRGTAGGLSHKPSSGPEAAAMAAETHERVAAAVEELEDEFRIVVVLRDVEEMDYAQIAEVLDVPVGTVKSRLYRARCILKDKLADLVD